MSSSTNRLKALEFILDGRRLTTTTLVVELGIHRRTAGRILQDFEEIGVVEHVGFQANHKLYAPGIQWLHVKSQVAVA